MKSEKYFKMILEPVMSLCIFILILLLASDLPDWVFISSMLIWIWKICSEIFGFYRPSRFFTGFLALISLGAVYTSFSTLIGRDPAVSLLVLLSSIKVLELKTEKDKKSLIILGLFLVVSKYMFSVDLIYILSGIPLVLILLSELFPAPFLKESFVSRFKLIIFYSMISLPITIFLFFFFPRFSQKLDEVHGSRSSSSSIGFGEVVGGGQIENLLASDELVMRVEFIGSSIGHHLLTEDMYFKGAVLNKAIGFVWKRNNSRDQKYFLSESFPVEDAKKNQLFYRVTLEPHYKNWIFVLPNTQAVWSDGQLINRSEFGEFSFDSSIENRTVYTAMALATNKNIYNPKKDVMEFSGVSNQVKALVSQIKNKAKSKKPEDIAESIISFYQEKKFRYTMRPGDQAAGNLDEFIFHKRKGFCEHFASATALLLLSSGVQARVIAGYQGGSYNFVGNFWEVRQKDAHSWIEYVNSENKWTHLDPVEFIAPLRTSLGGSRFLELNDHEILMASHKNLDEKDNIENIYIALKYWYENVNFRWNKELLSFDLKKQKFLMNYFNIQIGLLIVLSLGTAGLLSLLLSILFRPKKKESSSRQIYEAINQWACSFGLQKLPFEGPIKWRDRLIESYPHLKDSIYNLFEYYLNEAYKKQTKKFMGSISKHDRFTPLKKVKKSIREIDLMRKENH